MKAPSFTTEQIIERLEILWRKLEDEGHYVSANTVSLAVDEIKQLKDAALSTVTMGQEEHG